ncbi:NACHT domain-containing protein [Dactylosporangium sp. CA-092794]|uniref:NACHT domain-containing protein n=1 Tax=Dactylosporangium sp. CA-092794 TaxID=3239929 RepID=UPI003D8E5043
MSNLATNTIQIHGAVRTTAVWIALAALVGASMRSELAARGRSSDDALRRLMKEQAVAATHSYTFANDLPVLRDLYVAPTLSVPPRAGDAGSRIGVLCTLAADRHVVLVGDPGSGKSTVVNALTSESTNAVLKNDRDWFIKAKVAPFAPIALPATELVGRTIESALVNACAQQFQTDARNLFGDPPPGYTAWLVLLDGLDEIVNPGDRSRVLERLNNLLSTPYGPYRLLITTRALPAGEMAKLRVPGVARYEVPPFKDSQVEEYATKWFRASNTNSPEAAQEKCRRFLIKATEGALPRMMRSPLLLSIAAAVFEKEDESRLPTSRFLLYEKYLAHLLGGRGQRTVTLEPLLRALRSHGERGAELAAWFEQKIDERFPILLNHLGDTRMKDPHADLLAEARQWLRADAPHDLLDVVALAGVSPFS